MKKLLLLLAPLFLVMTFAPGQGRADQIAGSQYPYLGYGIRYFPLGGSGVADFTSMESGLYNPAAFGDVRRVTAGVSLGGLGSDYFLLNSRVSFPTNYGVLSGVFQTLESPSATDVGDIYGGKLIFSKLISDEWLFGAALNLGSVSGGPETGLYLSSDIGTIYRKSVEGSGFGIFDHSIGVAFRNLGKNISYDDFDGVPPLELDLGARAEIVRSGFYRGIISSHLGFPLNPFNTFYGVGVENVLFDTVSLKAGLNFGIEDIEPYSFGVDVFFNIKDTDFTLSYSLLPTKFPDGSTEYVHNAGVSVAFGRYDKKPPEAAVNVQNVYFSPNHDGINDRGRFNMSIRDNTLVFGWKLDIVDDGGRPVKTFEAQDVRKIRRMTLKKYVSRIFARKQEVEIPESIEWDGQDEEGNEVPDGTYHYTLTAWDENENRTVTQRGSLIVDTLVPIVEAKADDLLFSPNGDGAKETITIDVESANIEPDDEVTFLIEDRDGNAVYREVVRGWKGTHYVWDGRNSSGGLVDEGLYRFSVTALDRAANRTESTVEGIYVRTGYENVSVSPSMKAFSPNGDGHSDIDEIKLFTSGKEGLTFWQLAVVDESGKTMRLFEGGQDFPDVISYDGKTDGGRVLPDGLYTLQFKLLYESGNHPESFYKFLRIDNTPPSIAVDLSTTAFSPNGDGVKDTMTINNEIRADEGDTFEARITNAAGAVFRTLQYGTKPPRSVVWDGTGDGGTLPVEGTYTYTITGRDQVGNVTTVSSKSIKLVTGFEEVAVEPAYYAFSPNGDGTRDTVTFALSTTGREGIESWQLDIRDVYGQRVFTFDQTNAGATLPAQVEWKGNRAEGGFVEDGLYTATLTVLYDTGNNPVSKPKDVKVDTTPPDIELFVRDSYISPNDDGAKETMTFFQRIDGEEKDVFEGVITDAGGKVVKRFAWTGTPPLEVLWDGRDDAGQPLPEGVYSYSVSGRDVAGNSTMQRVGDIVLVTEYETVTLESSGWGISPNGDGVADAVLFSAGISSTEDLLSWKIQIYNAQGTVLRTLRGDGPPPDRISWDGTDEAGEVVPDGDYVYAIGLLYRSGNHPVSEPAVIVVDRTPPEVRFVVSPPLFSPDGDGDADTLFLNVDIGDKNPVGDWDIRIFRVWNGQPDRSRTVKGYKGSGSFTRTIRWDGYSDPIRMPAGFTPPDGYTYRPDGDRWRVLVDSASNYTAELRATDSLGNHVTVRQDFGTDILVIKTPYGLKIMINSIQFEFDKSDLLPASYPILDRLIQILDKFPTYRIRVVGHTDAIGTEEYNQKLSERRAHSVYRYLVTHDIDKERLTTEGRGEVQPIDDNGTESGRARNRRVEFYLTEKQ